MKQINANLASLALALKAMASEQDEPEHSAASVFFVTSRMLERKGIQPAIQTHQNDPPLGLRNV